MSSTPHPTIAGVTVDEYDTFYPFGAARFLVWEHEKWNREVDDRGSVDVTAYIDGDGNPRLEVDFCRPSVETAEIAIDMIRDQAAWLAAQGATT